MTKTGPSGPVLIVERKTRFELATFSLARRRATAAPLPLTVHSHQVRPRPTGKVPRRRFELLRPKGHHPLKMACLPIPPPRPEHRQPDCDRTLHLAGGQEWRDSNPRPAVLETAALPN